jgi:hypothetical protein
VEQLPIQKISQHIATLFKTKFQNFTEHELRSKISFKDRHQHNLGFIYCTKMIVVLSLLFGPTLSREELDT